MKRILCILVVLLSSLSSVCDAANFSITPEKIVFYQEKDIPGHVVALRPKTPDNDRGYFLDKVYNNRQYILIYRNYHYLGDFCHTPDVERIDVYDNTGTYLFAITEMPRQYVGTRFLFADHWVVIVNPVEGDFSGFAFIDLQDHQYQHIIVEEKGSLFIHAFLYQTGYARDPQRVWIIYQRWEPYAPRDIIEIDEHGQWRTARVQFESREP